MSTTELLLKFANPEIIQTLSISDKLYAGMIATILGMGITFTSLIVLQLAIVFMDKLLNRPVKQTLRRPEDGASEVASTEETLETDNELIAVVSLVIALQLKTSADNIVIRNIEKIDTPSPAWHKAGIIEQMNNRL